MKVGIVIYSQTGNTRRVAEDVKRTLEKAGHSVDLQEVALVGERKQGARSFELVRPADLGRPDVLILGAAVEAFSLSPVMARYIQSVPSLDPMRVACLVTQAFPYRWLGGNRAVRQMRRLCAAKGATVIGAQIVNWMGSGLEERIARAVDGLVRLAAGA